MSYEVKPGTAEVAVHSGEKATVAFTVNNVIERPLLTLAIVHTGGSLQKEWCSISPAEDTQIDANGNRVYEVTIAPEGVATPTAGELQLQAAWVDDPVGVSAMSPKVTVTLLQKRAEKTWWERHGKKVIAGAAGLVVLAVLLVVLLSGGGVEIERFAVAEGATLQVGTPVALEWEVGGEPAGLVLEMPPSDTVPLPKEQWAAGTAEWTPAVDGDVTIRLVALEDATGEGVEFSEVGRSLRLTVAPAPTTFAPPNVEAFDFSPKSVKAGEEVTFTWKVGGDVAALVIDKVTSGITLENPALPEGSHKETFVARAEPYLMTLVAIGKDGSRVASPNAQVPLKVTPSELMPVITVKITGTPVKLKPKWTPAPSSRIDRTLVRERVAFEPRVIAGSEMSPEAISATGGVRFENVVVEWNVAGNVTEVRLRVPALGVDSEIATSDSRRLGTVSPNTLVQVIATTGSGQKVVHDAYVGSKLFDTRVFKERLLEAVRKSPSVQVQAGRIRTYLIDR